MAQRGPQQVSSVDAWKKRGVHEGVTLPSGAVVTLRLPNIPNMVKTGTLPNPLLEAAMQQQGAEKITKEVVESTADYVKFIIPQMLIDPQVSEDDVPELPYEDIELLIAFANRSTDIDAAYRQLGGLDKLDRFREARGIWAAAEADEDGGEDGEAAADVQ